MAKVNNPLLQGFSGKLGDLVFYTLNGKTFVKRAPARQSKKPVCPARAKTMLKFKKSTRYAKAISGDPEIFGLYKAAATSGHSAYTLALRDANKPPVVNNIDVSGFTRRPGARIFIDASDDFKVASVTVSILDISGQLIEEGEAVMERNQTRWVYRVQKRYRNVRGFSIKAIARDLPGNEGALRVPLTGEF